MNNLKWFWDNTYSLDCEYYTNQFPTVDELLNDILASGQDPNYEILKNGRTTMLTAAEALGV
jgi:hypothetical protein